MGGGSTQSKGLVASLQGDGKEPPRSSPMETPHIEERGREGGEGWEKGIYRG